jgi:putative membrane protein
MSLLKRFIVNCIAVAAGALILPGIHIRNSFLSLIGVTLLLSILNTLLKPLLILLTIPVTIVTFGLFLIVINAIIILITGNLLDGFTVDGFWWAVLFSLIISFINSLFKDSKERLDNLEK